MKKSKFLQSSKDMLSRSFNPAKCKTSLRLAESRLKLLRNKKEVQVKQMKREIAQLLESGQDRTARIRVEHVVREEKMMAAYDLIEIYCELIVARLPIIETQKTCPIDLKEAIASVIFASPRCGDVPELLDIRKHFTAKYGKEFTTAATELRPACGVGRMLVEKLSATAPDGQTKIKILTAIADEHNIKWDPSSLEEKDSVPSNDLLNGPSTFTKESNVYVEPSRFEAPSVQAPPSNNNMHIPPLNFSQQDPRNSSGTENLPPTQNPGVNATIKPKERPPALGDHRPQLFQGDVNTISPNRHRWHMEFKDATSAAQAAAESAERASMAARAAAELSSGGRIMRQYSSESHKSDVYVLKDEGPEPYVASDLTNEKSSEEPVDRLISEHTMLQNEQIDHVKTNSPKTDGKFKDGYGGTKAYNVSASLKSKASTDDDLLDHNVPAADGHSRKNSLKGGSRGEMSMNKQSFKHEAESVNNWAAKSENFREESVNSSRSHSGVSDDVNIFATVAGEDAFVATDKGEVSGKASQKSSHESASLFYDKYDSDTEDHGFDYGPKYDEQDLEFHLPSPSQKAHEHLSVNRESWYPGSSASTIVKSDQSLFFTKKNSSPDLSEKLTATNGSELDNFMPVTFDDSDGPTFESDEDIKMSRHPGSRNSTNLLSKHNESRQPVLSPYNEKEHSGFDQKHSSPSFDDELKYEEMKKERNQGKKFDADSAENFSLGKPSVGQPDLGFKKSQVEPIDFDQEPSPDRGDGLNFGKLTGGLRHKGHNHPPYLKNHFDGSSSSSKEEESTTKIVRSSMPSGPESPKKPTMPDDKKSTRRSKLNYDLVSDSSEEEDFLLKNSGDDVKEFKTESRLGTSNSVFDSDSDLGDDAPKEYSLPTKPHMRSGISRRTKASPSSPGSNFYSKMRVRPEGLDSGVGMDRVPKTSYISETPIESDKSGQMENNDQPTSMKVAAKPAKSSYWGPPEQANSAKTSEARDSDASTERKRTNSYSPETQQEGSSSRRDSSKFGSPVQPKNEKTSFATMQDSKISWKSPALEEPSSSSQPKKEASVRSENPKASTLNKSDSNKASHVHPKLPDYDTFLQSFQRNRS